MTIAQLVKELGQFNPESEIAIFAMDEKFHPTSVRDISSADLSGNACIEISIALG